MLAALMPQLYRALEKLPPEGAAEAAALLAGAPVVWTGNGFSPTDTVAFRCAQRTLGLTVSAILFQLCERKYAY